MKNLSIRFRILAGLVIVNFLGAIVVTVYLHQSVSGSLDVWAQQSVNVGSSASIQLGEVATDEFGDMTKGDAAAQFAEALKGISGAEYVILLDKDATSEEEYAKQREAANLPNDWDERENYVLLATTDEAAAAAAKFQAASADVPDIGKIVGVENGACLGVCHKAFGQAGDFWRVRFSDDGKSRAHVVFPVNNEKGDPVGVVYSIEDISKQADAARDSVYRTLAVFALTLLVATLAIGGMMDVLIFRRLTRMITSMEDISVRVAGGDFDAHFTPDGTNDEIGRFESFFGKFLDLVTMTLKSLIR